MVMTPNQTEKRTELRRCLREYAEQRETVFGLQARLVELIRTGLDAEFSDKEKRRFYREFVPNIDAYDPRFQPRSGVLGNVADFFSHLLGGDRRMTEDEVRRSVARLLEWI
jgi:hypothetical protein